jgi:hypothetical protein
MFRAAWLVASLLGSGCMGARLVEVTPEGGVVAIPSNTNCWPTYFHKAAEDLIQKQCPEGYVIDHEQEAVVGHHTTENTAGNRNSVASAVFGVGQETKTVESHDYYEWRIYFRRKGAPPARLVSPKESLPTEGPPR